MCHHIWSVYVTKGKTCWSAVRVSDKIAHRCNVLASCGFGILIQHRQNSQVLIRALFMELWALVLSGAWGTRTSHPFPHSPNPHPDPSHPLSTPLWDFSTLISCLPISWHWNGQSRHIPQKIPWDATPSASCTLIPHIHNNARIHTHGLHICIGKCVNWHEHVQSNMYIHPYTFLNLLFPLPPNGKKNLCQFATNKGFIQSFSVLGVLRGFSVSLWLVTMLCTYLFTCS